MTEKEAIAQDWKKVGDAMRLALGDMRSVFLQRRCEIPHVNSTDAFLNGFLTLNPFGTTFRNRCKHR